jgi:hypothetical protein
VLNVSFIKEIQTHFLYEKNKKTKKKTSTYDVGNLGPGLGQAHKCGGVKPGNGIPTLPS